MTSLFKNMGARLQNLAHKNEYTRNKQDPRVNLYKQLYSYPDCSLIHVFSINNCPVCQSLFLIIEIS